MRLKVIQARVEDATLRAIEDWRRKQTPIPSEAESVRRLVDLGLEASERPTRK
jgi:hypothetical protein